MSRKTKLTFSSSEDEIIDSSIKYQRKRKTTVYDSEDEFIDLKNQSKKQIEKKEKTETGTGEVYLTRNTNQNMNIDENMGSSPDLTDTVYIQNEIECDFENDLSQKLENASFEENFFDFDPKNMYI